MQVRYSLNTVDEHLLFLLCKNKSFHENQSSFVQIDFLTSIINKLNIIIRAVG